MNFSSFDYFLALARGVGACFCPENLARLLLAAQPHGRLEMLRMPDTMAYPISFGYTKHAYPWSVLADFIISMSDRPMVSGALMLDMRYVYAAVPIAFTLQAVRLVERWWRIFTKRDPLVVPSEEVF